MTVTTTRTDAEKTATPSVLIHLHIKRDRDRYVSRLESEGIADYRKAVAGDPGMNLSDEMKEVLEGLLQHRACENIGHKVTAEARDRLTFESWECEDEKVQEFLTKLFTREKIKERQSAIHYDTLLEGDHALAVNWDNAKKRVRIYREPWYDGTEGLFIAYNALDEPVYAVKEWIVQLYNEDGSSAGQAIRRVVYFNDRFERWISNDQGATWTPFPLPEDNGVWPIRWETMKGEPLGIPYIHFRNSGKGQSTYGNGELAGGVLGLIVQVQDLHYSMSGSARFTGFPVITATGVEMGTDSDGNETELKAYPGGLLHSPNNEAEFGHIPAGDPQGLINTRREKLHAISTSTQTPFHVISGGDWPSGEALIRAEQPAVGKANSQKETLQNCWASVGHLAVKVQNRFGNDPELEESIEKALITCRFASTERRDPLSKSVIISNLGDRISDREALRIYGYTEAEADTIMEEKEEEARNNAETQALMFDRGVGTGLNRGGAAQAQEDDNAGTGAQQNRNASRSRRRGSQGGSQDAGEGN